MYECVINKSELNANANNHTHNARVQIIFTFVCAQLYLFSQYTTLDTQQQRTKKKELAPSNDLFQ